MTTTTSGGMKFAPLNLCFQNGAEHVWVWTGPVPDPFLLCTCGALMYRNRARPRPYSEKGC